MTVTDLTEDETLALYCKSKGEIDRILNSILPKLYWAEQVSEWRKDYREAKLFQDYAQVAVQRLSHHEFMMRLARDELVRREPKLWGHLDLRVRTHAAGYMNPELYDAWRETHV